MQRQHDGSRTQIGHYNLQPINVKTQLEMHYYNLNAQNHELKLKLLMNISRKSQVMLLALDHKRQNSNILFSKHRFHVFCYDTVHLDIPPAQNS